MDKVIRVELIAIFEKSENICTTEESFNSCLQANQDISISKNKLFYNKKEFKYKLQSGSIGNEHNFYSINLSITNESDIDSLSITIREIKKTVGKMTKIPMQLIWDDISRFYAERAYPQISHIENVMRKLITKFMIINVGIMWASKAIPDTFKASRVEKNGNKENKENKEIKKLNYHILYDTDFIQLSDILFNEYRDIDVQELISKLRDIDAKNIDENMISSIKKFIPTSNWDKHFKNLVDCDGKFLKVRWEKLYELRCKIAHNNTFSKIDADETKNLVDEILVILDKAVANLDKITVSETEKTDLASIFEKATTISENVKKAISLTNNLAFLLTELYDKTVGETYENENGEINILNKAIVLSDLGILPNEFVDLFSKIHGMRQNDKDIHNSDNMQIFDLNQMTYRCLDIIGDINQSMHE
ncbi:hypothetical protein EYY98_01955 [Obesumbacterium proteus]|nr:hypothetical protein EYY98_01955 [Obesumbacterium proteus]